MDKFDIDKQTLSDLDIFPGYSKNKSVFFLFDRTTTAGGHNLLRQFMKEPFADYQDIRQRKEAIAYIGNYQNYIRLSKEDVDFVEYYLEQGNYPTRFSKITACEKALSNLIKPNSEYYIISRGVTETIRLILLLKRYLCSLQGEDCPELLSEYHKKAETIFSSPEFSELSLAGEKKHLDCIETGRFDFYIRYSVREEINQILYIVYLFDVFCSVAQTAERLHLSYPEISANDKQPILIQGLYHPLINNPVANDICFCEEKNICFITGANMSGKSTFLKSFGIAVYLAHIGFPVPATKLIMPVYSGLITSINLSDDLQLGYSHFYNEVVRIKTVAHKLENKKLIVIFDELFRGTNVKDAFDATLSITFALSKVKHSIFIISTHIIEVAEQLQDNHGLFFRHFLSSLEKDNTITYNYQLKEGITNDRLGMYILNQEKIIETIEKASCSFE